MRVSRVTDFGEEAHGFSLAGARKLDVVGITDIGSGARGARVYWAVDEASVGGGVLRGFLPEIALERGIAVMGRVSHPLAFRCASPLE